MKDNPTYEKLLKIRQKEDISIKPCTFLRETLITPDGEVPLKLRSYQVQMVYHMLMMKNFICGDDTGLGKCKIHASLVQTDQGLVRLGEMHDWSGMKPDTFESIDREWKVLVGGKALPVKNFYYGGVKPTIKVETRYGLETEASRVHPLLVWREGKHQWVETQALQKGDYLCVERREVAFPTEEFEMTTDVTTKGSSEIYPLPPVMSPDLARFLGYYIGEGSLTSKSAVDISQCPLKNPEIHADILNLASRLFDYKVRHQDIPDIRIYSTYIRQFLFQNGLDYVTSHNRVVPDCILRSTRESNRQFLRGIFEAEGHVNETGIEFSTASQELGRQLQIMLLRFGVVSNRSPKVVKGYEHNDYWRLTIFGDDARTFRDKIGFVSRRKQQALSSALTSTSNTNHDVIPDTKLLIEALRALLKEAVSASGSNQNRKGSGFKQYGTSFVNTLNHIRNAGRNPTYGFLEKLLSISRENGLERSLPYLRLQEIQDTHYFYDPITSLEESEAEVFDIEVDSPEHAFVANGLVNHNTLETIATLCYLWEKEPDLRPIVLTTTSAMRQWGGEIDKFTDNVSWVIAEGGPDGRKEVYEDFFSEEWDEENPRILILNYPRLRRDKRDFLKYMEGHRCVLIMDEATAVKSTKSKTHHSCKQVAEKCERVYGLTATLIKNNLVEGYGIFKVVNPDVFRTKTAFQNNYCVTRLQPIGGGRRVKVVVGHSKDHIALFKDKIDPYYLGRAKHQVAKELPLLTTKEIGIPVTASQWGYYADALEGLLTINMGTDEEEERETTKLTQLIYCQQIVNDPYLIGNEGESNKVETLLSLLEEDFADEKVIVFSRFRTMVDRLAELVEAKGYEYAVEKDVLGDYVPRKDVDRGYARVTGSEDGNERNAGRIAFTETDKTNLIFLTMAGAEAMNLQQAQVMIFFDLPWSAGDYLQLVGRMIRIGSPHQNVYSIHLISEGPWGEQTIDHHVTKTLNKKMGFIEGALGERILGKEDAGDDYISTSDTGDIFDSLLQSARNHHGQD